MEMRRRLAKVVLAVAVAAGLAGSAVASAAPRPAAGSDRLAAWAVTATDPVFANVVLAVNPQSHTVYTGGQGLDQFSVIDGLTGKITGTIPAPADAKDGAVNPATGILYVSTEQLVTAINTQTGQVITTIPLAADQGQLVVDQQTNTIYTANGDGILVIDGSTNTVSAVIDLHTAVAGMALDQRTHTLYAVNSNGGSVWVIDTNSNTVPTSINVGQFPRYITVDPITDKVYVDNQGDHSVSVINGATNAVTATFDLQAEGGLVADPQTDTIYAADSNGGIRAIDGRTNEIEATFAPGENLANPGDNFSNGLAIDPAAEMLYTIDDAASTDGPDILTLSVITSCAAHVSLSPSGNCAQVAAEFQPAAVSFSSPEQGVAVGTTSCQGTWCLQATMMATADGGKTWSFLRPPLNIGIGPEPSGGGGLFFTSPDNGWLYGGWHTRNGGATWQHGAPGDAFFNGALVLAMKASPTTVYAAVRPDRGPGQLFATPIGAVKWTQVPAINESATGLAVSGRSVWVTGSTHLWASADGRHWARYPARCPGTGYRLAGVTATGRSDVAFLCARPVAAGGQSAGKEVLVSTDGGRTVHLAGSAPVAGIPQGFASPPGDPAVMTIAAGRATTSGTYWIYRSANGGRTWTTQTIQGVALDNFRSLTYTSRRAGWLVLAKGADTHDLLLHTTDGGLTWLKATL